MRPILAKGVALSAALLMGGVGASANGLPAAHTEASQRAAPLADAVAAERGHSFYFTRAAYSGGRGGFGGGRGGGGAWATDYPKADQQFLVVLRRLTNLDAFPFEHPIRLDDPNIRRFPFIYTVEVGNMNLSEEEVTNLRNYLLAGGFMIADDFWGTYEWANFEAQMRRVFPEYSIVDLPRDHEIFSAFYNVSEIIQVPNVGNGESGGPTHERDGYTPYCRGIIDDEGRLLVVVNWNTDLGDAWEWAERPAYPLKFSTYAYQMGVNFIVYAMSH